MVCARDTKATLMNPSPDMTTAITRLIIDGVSPSSALLDSFLILHAGLVAALHKVIGMEFGLCLYSSHHARTYRYSAAHFVQTVVTTYEAYYTTTSSLPSSDKSKEANNLLSLLSQLYNFQVISCLLIYDIIRTLLASNLSELDIELLLQVSRSEYCDYWHPFCYH